MHLETELARRVHIIGVDLDFFGCRHPRVALI
jgi:hypothetical protein